MNLIYSQIIIFAASLLLITGCVGTQTVAESTKSKTLHAVYAGTETDAQGKSQTIAFYFRPNGTYATKLDQPDWQTQIVGTYSIEGNIVTFLKNEGGESTKYKFNEKQTILSKGDVSLNKYQIANSIPAKHFETIIEHISEGWGSKGDETQRIIGNPAFNFDGKGGFSSSSYSLKEGYDSDKSVLIGNGTYTITDSLLILTDKIGVTTKLSFFYFEENNEVSALIGGNIYRENEKTNDERQSKINAIKKEMRAFIDQDGLKILQKANLLYGGDKLDNLKTLRIKATDSPDFETLTLLDIQNKKVRYERRGKNGQSEIKQLEGDGGWSWADKKKSSLSDLQKKELKSFLYSGVLSLRSSVLSSISVVGVNIVEAGTKVVIFEFDGERYATLFVSDERDDFLLLQIIINNATTKTISFKMGNLFSGIVFPRSTISELSNQTDPNKKAEKIYTKISAIEVNPNFTEQDWAVPN